MDAKNDNILIDRLRVRLDERHIGVPDFERETGIPKDRVYKWLKNNAKPKADDVKTIERWLSNEVEKLPIALKTDGVPDLNKLLESNMELARAHKTMADAQKILAEANLLHAKNQERTLEMLWELFGKLPEKGLELPTSGTPGTSRIKMASSEAQL